MKNSSIRFYYMDLGTRNLDFVACEDYCCCKIGVTVGNASFLGFREITVFMYEPGTYYFKAFFLLFICVLILK